MPQSRQKTQIPEVKPFRLVKYFAITSFIVLIIVCVPFTLFISKNAKEALYENYKDYALEIGGNIDHQLLVNFAIPMVMQYGSVTLSSEPQRKMLDRAVKKATENLNVELINLHSVMDEGVIVYSTDEALIKKKTDKTEGYRRALSGELYTELISEGNKIWGLGIEGIGGHKKVRTYIPLKFPFRDEIIVIGIFEMLLDMTEQYNSILKRQYTLFGVFALIMIIIFFTLLLVVRKAETIIEARTIEQHKLVEQLNLAERLAALGEMVAGVAHEIKNPLGIIQSTAELLSNMPHADESQKKLSGVIGEESVRLNRIVTEFLDFARPHELNLQYFELGEIIEKNLDFFKPEIDKKGIDVETNLGEGRHYPLTADHGLLYRGIMNLIINAIQAIEGEGKIIIHIGENKGKYSVVIKDTGKGISEDNLKKIFNPFFTTKEKGSGLGLPIVRKIIEGHSGTIDIESTEGVGTKVALHLPKNL